MFQVQHETVQTNFGCTCELMENWLLEGGYIKKNVYTKTCYEARNVSLFLNKIPFQKFHFIVSFSYSTYTQFVDSRLVVSLVSSFARTRGIEEKKTH